MCNNVDIQCLYKKELFLVKKKLFVYYVCVSYSLLFLYLIWCIENYYKSINERSFTLILTVKWFQFSNNLPKRIMVRQLTFYNINIIL